MTSIVSRLTVMPAVAAAVMLCAWPASAQQTSGPLNFFDQLFGGSERVSPAAPSGAGDAGGGQQPVDMSGRHVAQAPSGGLMIRIDRLEARIRQLTGVIEELQHRNRQLESRLRDALGGRAPAATPESRGSANAPQQQTTALPPPPAPQRQTTEPPSAPPQPAASPARRNDAFDPTLHPGAPGAPHVLGTIPARNVPADPGMSGGGMSGGGMSGGGMEVGAPGGRDAGAPLDLGTMTGGASRRPIPGGAPQAGQLPPPPPRSVSGTGTQVATLPPSNSPRDNYDLAYGYILHKDYALAESGFRRFLKEFPEDRMAPDANYWLGESLFQRQRYREAAELFLAVSTKFESTAKAPDALLRLGQSLAALGEKDAACASLAEVGRKYPRASLTVRQGVQREQKRVHC